MTQLRTESDLPLSTQKWGWKYHHLGVPTTEKKENERYLPQFKFYISGFTTSPFGVEWMRFDTDSPFDKLIREVPHLAFEVPDLDYELANRGFNVIIPPNLPDEGVRVAFIEHNGAPIELIEFDRKV